MVQVKKGSNQGPEVYLILEMLLKIDCTSQKENLVEKYVFTWKGLVQVRSSDASAPVHGKRLQGLEAPKEDRVPIFEPWALLP